MTPRQSAFIEQYILDRNGTQAAIRAGYSENGAATQAERLLANAEISAEIAKRLQAVSEKADCDATWVLRRLREEADFTGDGASHSARVKALELIGKHIQFFPPEKRELSGKDGAAIPVALVREVVVRTREEAKGILDSDKPS